MFAKQTEIVSLIHKNIKAVEQGNVAVLEVLKQMFIWKKIKRENQMGWPILFHSVE